MIQSHNIDALSALFFILGVLATAAFAYALDYIILKGVEVAAPMFISNDAFFFIVFYVLVISIIIAVVSTALTYRSIKDNRHRLLEFSAGFLIANGGFLLGYLLYWLHKKLFNKEYAGMPSYIMAVGITFVVLVFLTFIYLSFTLPH